MQGANVVSWLELWLRDSGFKFSPNHDRISRGGGGMVVASYTSKIQLGLPYTESDPTARKATYWTGLRWKWAFISTPREERCWNVFASIVLLLISTWNWVIWIKRHGIAYIKFFSAVSGLPALLRSLHIIQAVTDVISLGFAITVFPQARAGAIFQVSK